MAPLWSDFFKLFSYSSEADPLARRKDPRQFSSAGISQPEAIGADINNPQNVSGGLSSYRQTNDMIDTTTLSNRAMRYKEYERLRNVPEIEAAMTVFADESCVAGNTKIATPFGFITIKELTEKRSDERFLVYCYDFEKKDYTLGWAYSPRIVKRAPTITVVLDDGSTFTATEDHRVLKKDGTWCETGDLEVEDELMPFYRVKASQNHTRLRTAQYPRIYTKNKGWIHERQFVDDWRTGKITSKMQAVNLGCRLYADGLKTVQVAERLGHDWRTVGEWLAREGFTTKEIKRLNRFEKERRIIGIEPGPVQDVYDLSVEKHMCFATDSVILHNCQKDENGNIIKITTENQDIKDEIDFLLMNRKMLNLNRNAWVWFKNLCISGDYFVELVINPENPKEGIYRTMPLPCETMYRIETVKGKIIEYQQSKEGPDYQAIVRGSVNDMTDTELNQTTAIRFAPSQIVHFRIGDDRKTFYPYGQSLIEPARGPAHSLRMLEDAMVVYRLCLVGDTVISLQKGTKNIRDIKVGDTVLSYDYDGKLIPTKVVCHVNNGIQNVFSVKSKHIEIVGTATHPLLVNRQGTLQYVDIQDLIPKTDKLICVTRNDNVLTQIPKSPKEPWAKLSSEMRTAFRNGNYENISKLLKNCKVKDNRAKQFLYAESKALPINLAKNVCDIFELDHSKLIITKKSQVYSERINLPDFVDEEFARLFGFLIGDGSISRKLCRIVFSAGEKQEVNQKYASLLQKYFGKVSHNLDKRGKFGNYCVSSARGAEIFLELGYIPGEKNKRIPQWVFTSKPEIRKAFVEGISDADGCQRTTFKGTWFSTIELCNKELVKDIKSVWASIGLSSGKIKERQRKGGHEITKNLLMKSTTSHSVTISEKELPQYENICSITPCGQEEVYDITVDNELHNFIANGTPTHNTRAPERRVFYIDVGQLPPFKAEAFMDRIKDQFRKRKVTSNSGSPGANQVEEKWMPPAQDEDYWLPIRPNSNTRIDTLPGAENLGEIDDAVYFRNKLLTALNFPKNYFNNEDPGATRITLSAQDVKFARMIERLQSYFEDGIMEIAERHLQLRGYPEDSYKDLRIKMTPPSDWRELSRAEVVNARYGNAGTLKGSQLMSDFDIMTKILKYNQDDADEMLARLKIQKLEDLKLQVLAQNPQLLGVGIPSAEGQDQELGAEAGGPNSMPEPGGEGAPPEGELPPEAPPEGLPAPSEGPPSEKDGTAEPVSISEPTDDDIKKYDLELQGFDIESDLEDIDFSVRN